MHGKPKGRPRPGPVLAIAALIAASFLFGCAQHARVLCEPLSLASRGLYGDAVESLDETSVADSKDDRFLYHAQRGHLLHLAGRYKESNAEFERAAAVVQELEPWSVSETITDYTLNEAAKAYAGEDYERAYIHYYIAMNYLAQGELDDAIVECRRLDEIFRELDARYEEGTERYQDDGFVRYLSGLLYEARGESDDAFIDYELAIRAYRGETGRAARISVPDKLIASYVALGERLGRGDRVAALIESADSGGAPECPSPSDVDAAFDSEIVVLVEQGWAPYKHEEALRIPIVKRHVPEDYWERGWLELDAVVKIAVPAFESVPEPGTDFVVTAERVISNGTSERALGTSDGLAQSGSGSRDSHFGAIRRAPTEKVQDLDALARWSLERRLPALIARSAIRATLKTVAVLKAQHDREEAREKREESGDDGSIWSWLGDIFVDHVVPVAVSETEQADTRSWILLPSSIWMARVPVQPGQYEITIEGEQGPETYIGTATVGPGQKAFLSHRAFGSPHPMRCDGD